MEDLRELSKFVERFNGSRVKWIEWKHARLSAKAAQHVLARGNLARVCARGDDPSGGGVEIQSGSKTQSYLTESKKSCRSITLSRRAFERPLYKERSNRCCDVLHDDSELRDNLGFVTCQQYIAS